MKETITTYRPDQKLCEHGVPHPEGHKACDGCCIKIKEHA